MLHRIVKIFSLACLTLILIASGVLGWHFIASQAQGQTYELGGWYYSSNYDWISLNSGNPELAGYAGAPYKVMVADGNVSGWGWSKNVGWVCFGETCDPNRICDLATPCDPLSFGTALPPGGWHATIDLTTSTTHKIEGWAKIVSLKDSGWLHLGLGASTAPGQMGEQCYDCQAHCDAYEQICDEEGNCHNGACQTYSTTNYDSCNSCFTRTKFDNVNIPDPAVDSVSGGSGNTCFQCAPCTKIMSGDGINSRLACNACASCYLYGGASDAQTGGSLGWGWNGNDNPGDGAGWVQFNPAGGESGLVFPWLQTQYGAVFGSKIFRQRSVVSGINATYCIFAQDVFNFRSQNCAQRNISGISLAFPQKNLSDASYKNALGRLDITGLSTAVRTSGSGQKYNKYGNVVNTVEGNPSWTSANAQAFNNRVFVINGNLQISSGFYVKNGSGSERGNGLVIVNGNLIVDGDFFYDPGAVPEAELRRLASVAWIVKGDIIIRPNVKNAVGAFIALGLDGQACLYSDDTPCGNTVEYPKFKQNSHGVFSSGASDSPLVISGLLLAKAFNFERTYSNIVQGSEKIIYDGRLIANPPPGLKNLLEILPVIRDFEY